MRIREIMSTSRLTVLNREKRLVGMVSLGNISGASSAEVAARTLEPVSRPAAH